MCFTMIEFINLHRFSSVFSFLGRRICVGERLAKMEIFIFLTHILRRFSFEKTDPLSQLNFKGRNGVTYGPHPYQLCAKEIK